jgi:hypothetical protein
VNEILKEGLHIKDAFVKWENSLAVAGSEAQSDPLSIFDAGWRAALATQGAPVPVPFVAGRPAQGAPTPPYHEFDKSFDVAAQGAPGTREALSEALKDHADWLEQQIALWKRVMSKEAELHNTHAWERASARVTAYKDCLEMLRAAALAQPGAPTKEG